MARHGCCYSPVESERHERPKPLRLRSVVESDLCSDAYWLALCIWASFETGSKIVFNLLPYPVGTAIHDVAEYYKAGTFGGAIRTSRSRLYAQDKAEKATQRVKH